MKKKIEEIVKKSKPKPNEENITAPKGEKITRAAAIKKVGYIAVSATTMMILLDTLKAQSMSPPPVTQPPSNSNAAPAPPPKTDQF